ncbi:MAG: hypothetical protein Q6363_008105 [Candidatus Njordarchaeota archaeon]
MSDIENEKKSERILKLSFEFSATVKCKDLEISLWQNRDGTFMLSIDTYDGGVFNFEPLTKEDLKELYSEIKKQLGDELKDD